jgi:hypothetical protein
LIEQCNCRGPFATLRALKNERFQNSATNS